MTQESHSKSSAQILNTTGIAPQPKKVDAIQTETIPRHGEPLPRDMEANRNQQTEHLTLLETRAVSH